MKCSKCGAIVDEKCQKCMFCGTTIQQEEIQIDYQTINEKANLLKKYKYVFAGIIILLVIIIVVIVNLNKPKTNERAEVLLNIEKTNYLKFTLSDKEFYLGEKVSSYKKNGYSYEDQYMRDESYVESDSIAIYNFYNNNEAKFLGAFYCAETEKCKYDDSILIKINFYEESDVVIDDFIKYGIKYDKIVEKYGKEDGTFYQDENLLVWTFGEKGKIGNPYYILRFDYDSFLSDGELIEIRMGIWWYDEEYDHTVIKKNSKEDVSDEK